MSRFDNPGQVLLLFAGATVASVVLILLVDAEARSRKLHKEPEIENGNLFSAIGHQMARLVSRWTHHNSSSRATADNTDDYRVPERRLQRALQWLPDDASPAPHKVRHSKSRRKPVVPTPPAAPTPAPTVITTPVSRRRLESHDTCYNTNEVLLIIAITCAVNFAFIFVIMALVHLCNRSNKVAGISGLESLVVAEGGDRASQKLTLVLTSEQSVTKLCESSSYDSVQEYVNSLPAVMNDGCDRTSSMLSLHSLEPLRSNINNKRRLSHNLPSAFSMEDLLFVD